SSPEVRPVLGERQQLLTRLPKDLDLLKCDLWACGLMLKELYDGKQFTWTEELTEEKVKDKPRTMNRPEFEKAVKEEFGKTLLELAEKNAKGTLNPEEQAKYQVYKVIAGLFGVRIKTKEKDPITPEPAGGLDFS